MKQSFFFRGPIFIGYDENEIVAFHALCHSIIKNATKPVRISPIYKKHLNDIHKRPLEDKQSNAFSFTRFLTPYLNNFEGHAIYMDCDMMIRADIFEIFLDLNKNSAVSVVKHDYIPKTTKKYLNNNQYNYSRKNWSSLIVWNCAHTKNRRLTPKFIDEATGLFLHSFNWLQAKEIGELDIKWNWLVGEYKDPPIDTKNIHWTLGGPYFSEFIDSDFAEEWISVKKEMISCKSDK